MTHHRSSVHRRNLSSNTQSRHKGLAITSSIAQQRLLRNQPEAPATLPANASPLIKKAEELQAELAFLTSYSSDTVYKLHYSTMTYDYVSPAIERLLGFSPQEMKKINFRALILETRLVTNGMKTLESFDALERQRREGDVNKWQADYLMRTKDGRKIWVADISYPWFDERGNIIGSVGSLRDITDRVDAENQVKEELSRLANTDALTGMSNRREYFSLLENELRRVKRSSNDVSILLVDIDHFRTINEKSGNDVGDYVLVEISHIIRKALRETDMAARIGGEEFGVILPDTPSEGAYWVAERIRMNVLKHEFNSGSDKRPLGCTVSIGVASAHHADQLDATQLYKIADTRLFIAKNSGRNQVSIDEVLHMH